MSRPPREDGRAGRPVGRSGHEEASESDRIWGEPHDVNISVVTQHADLALPDNQCERLMQHVASAEGVALGHVTLVLADHETVLDLNRRYLEHDYHTDVLSFDYAESDDVIEGEIYVDLDTARERCEEFGVVFKEEAMRYVVHGLLHLIGYSDDTNVRKQAMHALEDRYLTETGLRAD